VQVAGDINDLLSIRHRLTGPRRDGLRPPSDWEVLAESATERQSTSSVGRAGQRLRRGQRQTGRSQRERSRRHQSWPVRTCSRSGR
jgi:hypothetical protein